MYAYQKKILDDFVFNFIYGCALHDAVLQKAFIGDRKWINNVSEAKQSVKKYVDKIINGDFKNPDNATKSNHDKLFFETAENVCKQINSKKPKNSQIGNFTFGNAQKLINMTIKHVYAHTYSINSTTCNFTRDNFRHCHCPMDSIMLEKVWNEYAQCFSPEERKKVLGKNFCSAWGCMGFNDSRYENFQNAIKAIIPKNNGNIFPIEYDYIIWKNSNKKQQKQGTTP